MYASIDINKISVARRKLDEAGHYSRPDIFQLNVNTKTQNPVNFDDEN